MAYRQTSDYEPFTDVFKTVRIESLNIFVYVLIPISTFCVVSLIHNKLIIESGEVSWLFEQS